MHRTRRALWQGRPLSNAVTQTAPGTVDSPFFLIVDGKRSISDGIWRDENVGQWPRKLSRCTATHLGPNIAQHAHKLASKRALVVLARKEGDRLARLACASRPSAAVHKVLCGSEHSISDASPSSRVLRRPTGRQRERDIDHEVDIGNIQPARRDIGRDEHLHLALLERVERAEPRVLVQVAMQACDRVARAPDRAL